MIDWRQKRNRTKSGEDIRRHLRVGFDGLIKERVLKRMRKSKDKELAVELFNKSLRKNARRVVAGLTTPAKIQGFLDSIPYSTDDFYRSPLRVLRDRAAHCFDGALFGAATLRLIGFPPLIVDLLPNDRDDEHLIAVYRVARHWGAVAKSNYVGLRYREPIYRDLRELAMSYFEQYYNIEGEKTLRGYTMPLNLATLDELEWMTSEDRLDLVASRTDEIPRRFLLTRTMIARLSPLDKRSCEAGLLGANRAGLFEPLIGK